MPVTESDRALASSLVSLYCNRMRAFYSDAPPDIAAELLQPLELLPAEVTETQIATIERRLPAPLPPLFVAYLTCAAFRGVEWKEYILPAIPPGEGPAAARTHLLDRRVRALWPCGYLPFASGPCGDPVCFDIQNPTPQRDYSVVVFNHDIIPRDAWAARVTLHPHARVVAPSFVEFLRGLCTGDLRSEMTKRGHSYFQRNNLARGRGWARVLFPSPVLRERAGRVGWGPVPATTAVALPTPNHL